MTDPTLKLLGSPDFNPDKYVRELSQSCVGGPELVRLRNKVQVLSEETSANLKKNVYQNYMQFIDTAREISHLESEMYQLSHLLSEQRALLNSLAATSILGDETPVVLEVENKEADEEQKEEARKQQMASILEKVEGCSAHVEVPDRILLHEGDLLELDADDEINPLRRIHGYLFNDGLMLASWNANRRGPMRYKLEAFYEMGSLAVVNVRDLGNVKYAFKLLAFPDTRVLQSISSSAKKEWLEKFDQAKRARLSQDQARRESVCEKVPSRTASIDSPSFTIVEEKEDDTTIVHPDWLLDTPEELDVCVAQRHFEEALNVLQKARDYFTRVATNAQDHVLNEMKRKVEQRHTILTEVLMKELEVSPDKSAQGGLRAARRAVRLLNQLGKQAQSCDLFLRLCSSIMRTQCKRVKREGSTTVYIRNLSSAVFTNMCHMTEEFLRAFPDSPSCASAFVVWASGEIGIFSSHFIKQVFIPQTSLSTLTECVVLVKSQCERLCTYGIDLRYQLDGLFRTPLMKAIADARDKAIDAVKVRALEDKWRPTNFKSKTMLARRLQEYAELGINLENHITGDVWIQLTSNTLSFAKLLLSFVNDCLQLQNSELLFTIDQSLFDIFDAQIKHIEQALRGENSLEERAFITKNTDFILIALLDWVQTTYRTTIGFPCKSLAQLQQEHSALLHGISPTQRTVPKYSSNEYL